MSSHTTEGEHFTKNKLKKGIDPIVFFFSLAAVLAIGFVVGIYRYQIFASVATVFNIPASAETINTDQLQRTYRQLVANYDGTLDTEALITGANRGMVAAAGDKYTVFFDAEEASKFNGELEGSIGGGVGAQVGIQDEKITLVKILSNTPAEKAGLLAGDKVIAINGETTEGYTTEQAVEKIRGDIGTTVKLRIIRGTEQLEVSVTRAEISSPSVTSEVKDGIGILTISRFDQETGRLAREAAKGFKDAKVKGVILDVRSNPGGFLTAAQDVAGIWLNDKVVVVEKSDGVVVDELRSGKNQLLEGVPTVVLVDANSASASEIVAGALKDHKAATLVGEKTFGKGTVQRLIPLTNGAMLKVTVARWFTPNGVNLSKGGIAPDKEVLLSEADIRDANDLQKAAAVQLLTK